MGDYFTGNPTYFDPKKAIPPLRPGGEIDLGKKHFKVDSNSSNHKISKKHLSPFVTSFSINTLPCCLFEKP